MKAFLTVAILLSLLAPASSSRMLGASSIWLLSSSQADAQNCKDGVCELPTTSANKTISHSAIEKEWKAASVTKTEPDNLVDLVAEMCKLGYNAEEAKDSLSQNDFDVSKAAEFLDNEGEKTEKAKKLSTGGMWTLEASRAALNECNWNVTQAQNLLENEEASITAQFSASVAEMVDKGWDELVARQALLTQWTIDQRKAQGTNTSTSRDVLDQIRPSLKRSNNTGTKGVTSTEKKGTEPKPAKKEDCVFEVNSNNFQKVVLDSPVPVILDVYADWCGPCKQLGPVLENAAMKSGGMFRLAKVNSDHERGISEMLSVTGLPTVFAVNNGVFSDRFVGMLPQDQLQQFLVRCVTGYGDRVQSEITEAELSEATEKLSQFAGLASISFKNREKLRSLVEEALELDGAITPDFAHTDALRTTLLYIANAQRNIRAKKYRIIKKSSKVFSEKIYQSPACLKLLDIAGFKEMTNETKGEDALELVHTNAAILSVVGDKINECITKKKFAHLKVSSPSANDAPQSATKRARSFKNAHSPPDPSSDVKPVIDSKTKELSQQTSGLKISLKLSDRSSVKKRIEKRIDQNLEDMIEGMLKGTVDEYWKRLDLKSPLPRRRLDKLSPELKMSLIELSNGRDISIEVVSDSEPLTDSNSIKGRAKVTKKKQSTRTRKTNTLQSIGHYQKGDESKKKINEYFGGDSTVMLSGDEEDNDNEDKDDSDIAGAGTKNSKAKNTDDNEESNETGTE